MKNSTLGAILFGCAAFSLFMVYQANAQTPAPQPDVDLKRSGSTYPFTCQPTEPIDKLMEVCAVRTDLDGEPIELGCALHSTIEPVTFNITVARTPFEDAEIRCYARDSEGNESGYSGNVGRADFTPNGKPFVVSP